MHWIRQQLRLMVACQAPILDLLEQIPVMQITWGQSSVEWDLMIKKLSRWAVLMLWDDGKTSLRLSLLFLTYQFNTNFMHSSDHLSPYLLTATPLHPDMMVHGLHFQPHSTIFTLLFWTQSSGRREIGKVRISMKMKVKHWWCSPLIWYWFKMTSLRSMSAFMQKTRLNSLQTFPKHSTNWKSSELVVWKLPLGHRYHIPTLKYESVCYITNVFCFDNLVGHSALMA